MLLQAGQYQGPPAVATVTGPGSTIINNNVIVANPGVHYQPDFITQATQNTGNMLFGGLLSAVSLFY